MEKLRLGGWSLAVVLALAVAPLPLIGPTGEADAAERIVVVGHDCNGNTYQGIDIQFPNFIPADVTVPFGTLVTWHNLDGFEHTSTEGEHTNPIDLFPLWDSGPILGGGSFSVRFCISGSFDYHCHIHPNMQGHLTVQPRY
jgi:plastocyanin